MALFAVPIVGGVLGGAYCYGAYQMATAVDSAVRTSLADDAAAGSRAAGTGQQHALLLTAGWAAAYAAGARALRPAFSHIPVPASIENSVQFARSVAPGLARHTLACTAAVAAAAAGTAAYDVRLAQQQQQHKRHGT